MSTESVFKATCSNCKRKKNVLDLITVTKRRNGSYNRAPSGTRGMVCRDCTNEAVDSKRIARYADGKLYGVYLNAGGIMWSTACDHFGIDYSDLPKSFYDAERNPDQFKARKVGA